MLIVGNFAMMLWQTRDPGLIFRWQLSDHGLRLWAFLTYAFLHVGWLHLIFNLVVLYILGNNINDRLGHLGYLGFYLGGAVFAGIGYILAGGQAVVGASGAVGAVMGAYLALFPRSHITLFIGFASIEVPGMYFVIIFFMYNLVMSLAGQAAVPQVAYEAHVAGIAYGFVVALLLLATRVLPRQQVDFPAFIAQWIRQGGRRA